MNTSRNVSLDSIACHLPKKTYENKHKIFRNVVKLPFHWEAFWGVKNRGFFDVNAGENETSAAIAACKKALDAADISGKDIDVVICSSSFPILFGETETLKSFRGLPRLSSAIKDTFGISRGFDTQSDCLSFLTNLEIAKNFIKSGLANKVLVCSSEFFSMALDMKSPVSKLFGDGAAAAVVSVTESNGDMLASNYLSNANYYKLAIGAFKEKIDTDIFKSNAKVWPYFVMADNGVDDMKAFIPFIVPKIVKGALNKINKKPKDIDYFIFHQPAKTIVKTWAAGLGISKNKYCLTMGRHGVLVSVSIPLTLCFALHNKKIDPYSKVVLAGAATGWNFGAQVWQLNGTKAIYDYES
jgi:2-heptyl-4(1H)-quinolone synthase subunit PqsC